MAVNVVFSNAYLDLKKQPYVRPVKSLYDGSDDVGSKPKARD